MNIKQDMSAGFNRKWVLEVNTEELEYIANAFGIAYDSVNMTDEFCAWCHENSDRIYKILDS